MSVRSSSIFCGFVLGHGHFSCGWHDLSSRFLPSTRYSQKLLILHGKIIKNNDKIRVHINSVYVGKRMGPLRLKNIKRTDFRVKIMNEILLGIQAIKMYAWENSFAKLVNQIRK